MIDNDITPSNGTIIIKDRSEDSDDRIFKDLELKASSISEERVFVLVLDELNDSNSSIKKKVTDFEELNEDYEYDYEYDVFFERKNIKKYKVKGKIRSVIRPTPKPKL